MTAPIDVDVHPEPSHTVNFSTYQDSLFVGEFMKMTSRKVVALDTELEADALLDGLQQIERQQGRVRKAERWGPRTLDLDILLFGNVRINSDRLQVPHYHMHARAFVLYPLAELAPDLQMPDGTPLQKLLQDCPRGDLQTLTVFIQQPDAQTGLTPNG